MLQDTLTGSLSVAGHTDKSLSKIKEIPTDQLDCLILSKFACTARGGLEGLHGICMHSQSYLIHKISELLEFLLPGNF